MALVVALLLVAVVRPPTAAAMPANPLPVELVQPDGTPITLYIRGDEHFNWFEDLRGFSVALDRGRYVYTRRDSGGQLVPTVHLVGTTDPAAVGLVSGATPVGKARALPPAAQGGRSVKAVPPSGTVKNLVVLCKFSDHVLGTHTRARADYDVLFNTVGGDPVLAPTGSVRDCFTENSYGILTLESTVVAWVTLPQTEAYYTDGSSGLGGLYPTNPQGMVEDALNLVDPLVDFGDFDTDDDGYIDTISIVHSGYGAETGGGGGNWMWSHRWSLWALPAGEWISSDLNGVGDNVKVFDYHTEPALWGTSGTSIVRIGVIVHETGHFFGLPDLYDTNGGGQGIGSYCMMANSWGFDSTQLRPPHFSAWCKVFLNWVNPTSITTPGTYVAPQVETVPTVFRIDQNYPSGEYLLIENRQPVGFDSAMPQGGLAIWHIDEAKGGNTDEGYPGQAGWPWNNSHYKVALLQADGNYELERGFHRGDGDELYRAGGVSAIDEFTVPGTDAYQGGWAAVTHNSIDNIGTSGANIAFDFDTLIDCNGNLIVDGQDIAGGTSLDCNTNGDPDECELSVRYAAQSPQLSPIGTGSPQSHTFVSPPPSLGVVVLLFEAVGDFSGASEWVDVDINGTSVGSVFASGANDCPGTPDPAALLVPKATFDAAVAGGDATVDMTATGDVNAALCSPGYIRVALRYVSAGASCNGNGIPDDCDIAAGTSDDCNTNGVPDLCDTAIRGVLLDADLEGGLPAGWSTTGTFQVTDQCGTASPDCGGSLWAYAGSTSSCTYGDGESGELVLPAITLGYGVSELRFCSRIDTEPGFDFARVRIAGTTVWEDSGGSGTWEEKVLDLSAFAGQQVSIAFQFTSDGGVSGTLGWQVDNVQLTSGVDDCNTNGVPDECEPDCNTNGIPDDCDVASGASPDINTNGIPDECDECVLDSECDDGDPCTDNVCDPPTGCVFPFNTNGCDDGNPCTDNDTCSGGVCGGVPKNCDDGVFCSGVETCAPGTGNCVSPGDPCGGGTWCDEAQDECVAYGDGDFDTDGDVDLGDVAAFQECFGTVASIECRPGNMTGDGSIDLSDYALFEAELSAGGPQ